MDNSLIVDYSVNDFADVIRQLLPSGEYWQDANNEELTAVILGIAEESKITHDEMQLSLLTDFDGEVFGWKLSDYQALLIISGGVGTVSDNREKPNLIYVSLDYDSRSEKSFHEFEAVRLPHTKIQWMYNALIDINVQAANATHIYSLHTHEVTQ